MVSNDEIKSGLEFKNDGLNPDEKLENMQMPYEWNGDICIFDFNSMQVEELSNRINKLFEDRGYYLQDGTILHGIYTKRWYTYEVEIYSNGEKTYLEISKAIGLVDKLFATVNIDSELDRLINKIKYLNPFTGYLVCDKCEGYYKLQKGESPYDFDKCTCGGKLRYVPDLKDINGSRKVCPSCGSIIKNSYEGCPVCGFELNKLPVTESGLIIGILNIAFSTSFFMMGVTIFGVGFYAGIVQLIFQPQSITNIYSYIVLQIILLLFIICFLWVGIMLISRIPNIYLKGYKKDDLNWAAIIIAFAVTIVIDIFGGHLPIIGPYLGNNIILGPLIGGFIAGCIAGKNYINGFVNGGIPAGIAGLIGIMFLLGDRLTTGSFEIILFGTVGLATLFFMVSFFISSISGIIGADIRKRISS